MWENFQWLNQPRAWDVQGDQLSVQVSPKTDFWRKTHYGFIRDSGHLFFKPVSGDFLIQARIRGDYAALYDQGGLMLRRSEDYWMKCGIEYVEGTQQASVVVTNDFSDWSVTPLLANPPEVWFRVKKRECSLEVFYSVNLRELTHELREVFAKQRFAAGQSHLLDTERYECPGEPGNFLKAQDLRTRKERVVAPEDLLRHAVGAAEVAAIGDRDAQGARAPAEEVAQDVVVIR
jgi:regulation of enolase protein 1 (concanavalin A-like superfamily)